jgi:hypothetical protein
MITAVTRGISSTIGLAREKQFDHKERKAALAHRDQSRTPSVASRDIQVEDGVITDEQEWALDEAADQPPREESDRNPDSVLTRTVSELVQDTIHDTLGAEASEISASQPTLRLPYPIIIPQRRPGTKGRGFARAYPPDLAQFGIDQDTFLRFLKSFHSASKSSPALHALYITASATSPIHGMITFAVSLSVTITLRYIYSYWTQHVN